MSGLHVHLYIIYIPGAPRGQKMTSGTLELKLQIVVSHHTDGGKWTLVCSQSIYSSFKGHTVCLKVTKTTVTGKTHPHYVHQCLSVLYFHSSLSQVPFPCSLEVCEAPVLIFLSIPPLTDQPCCLWQSQSSRQSMENFHVCYVWQRLLHFTASWSFPVGGKEACECQNTSFISVLRGLTLAFPSKYQYMRKVP